MSILNNLNWSNLIVKLKEISSSSLNKKDLEEEIIKKLKYFKPIIKENIFGKEISWIERDKPLTDEEINERYEKTT